MSTAVYDPKSIVHTLHTIELEIEQVISQQCPDAPLLLEEDLGEAMDNFLSRYDFRGNEVSLLSTQFALLRLRQEVSKAKDLIVDVNDLRALQDYTKRTTLADPVPSQSNESKPLRSTFVTVAYIVSAILLSIVIICCTALLYHWW